MANRPVPSGTHEAVMRLGIKNWAEFQHYRDRRPPWLKLHRALLDDVDWHDLPDASKALAPMLWLLASEHKDGILEATLKQVTFRLRMSMERFDAALRPLIAAGFVILLAEREQGATSESESEADSEAKGEGDPRRRAHPHPLPEDWQPGEEDLAWASKARPDLAPSRVEAETERFRNHARANDRRVQSWGPLWRNWISKTHAEQARAAPTSPSGAMAVAPADSEAQWRTRLRDWRPGKFWSPMWGPQPGETGCFVPAGVLADWKDKVQAGRAK